MSPTTLERPSEAPPAPDPEPSAPSPRPVRRHRRPGRRVWLIGLGASLLLHAALFLAADDLVVFGPPQPRLAAVDRAPSAAATPPGMRAYDIAPVASGDAAPPLDEPSQPPTAAPTRPNRPDQPTRIDPARAPAAAEPDAGRAPTSEPARPALSPAEQLSPRMYDRRLWVMPEDLPEPELSAAERARRRIYGKLREINDSIAAARAARRAWTDWTFTDDEGRRWGISPEGIHLGEITLPAPQLRGEREARERIKEWRRIRAQAARAQAEATIEERIQAIRERKDAERAAADTTGGGS